MTVTVVDTPLGGGALAKAAIAGTTPPGWYAASPRTVDAWRTRASDIAASAGAWLAPLRDAVGPGGSTLLERVDAGRGIVITAGQQAGLFGGPLYTWFKAIAALETARAIERETGVPAVPVFWAATDDADFAEAATTMIATPAGAEKVSCTTRAPEGVPMSHTTLGREVDALLDKLRNAAGSVADARPIEAAAAFRSGTTMGGAYVDMLRALLEPLGIAVIDAAHDATGNAARPHLLNALTRADAIHAALLERQSELVAGKFDVAVEVDRPLSLVFAWENGADSLPRKRRLTNDEAKAGAQNGTRLSPNVLLRPVIERQILPTAAYLAGPGEIAYFAQVSAVAHAAGAPLPLAIPRWSGMVIPRDVASTLRRFGFEKEDLRDPHAAEARIARATLAPDALAALGDLRSAIGHQVGRLDGLLTPAALAGAKDQLLRRVDKTERRIVAAAKRREAESLQAIAAARAVVYPFGKPQERALNAVPLWARHGDGFVDEVRAACAAYASRLVRGASD